MQRIPLSKSQQNIYHGVLQDSDPELYLIGKSYRLHRLELSAFLAALLATILKNPVQLCVLEAPTADAAYPQFLPQLQFDDIVRVRGGDEPQPDRDELTCSWSVDILAKPLVRYTVLTDRSGHVSGLVVYTHHILADGGATGIIEADLAEQLSHPEIPCVVDGLARLVQAHHREAARVAESLPRLSEAVQRELADQARDGDFVRLSNDAPGSAARGVLRESVHVCGKAFDAILALSQAEHVPLNVLVAAAAVAVDASRRQSTQSLLVHAVDNRFGEPDLNVATCLVNSVAHPIRFSAFASVQDVVRTLDRAYVKAVRRRWLREEHYRRMYLAINRTSQLEALTLNFIREPCAPSLRPYLVEAPVATDIGPVEGMTVACVLDEDQRTFSLAIWDRADLPDVTARRGVAERIATALESMPAMWHRPIALTVGEWFGISPEGVRRQADWTGATDGPRAAAWFLDSAERVRHIIDSRRYVYPWIAWLVRNGTAPGDILIFIDDNTDKTIDLLIAAHLAGCGYSVCDAGDELPLRVKTIADNGYSVRPVDVAAAQLAAAPHDDLAALVDQRIKQVAQDNSLATKTAYVMPTSGSTGQPKLVRVSHGSLALFCEAARRAYGWGPNDTVLQCAPLTSDISVEEILCGVFCGAELVRSTAMRSGDVSALSQDLVTKRATIVDLPTAVWHLLCEDADALDTISRSALRQVIIGGEAVRPNAVDKWIDSPAGQHISLISSYGPTEATVVATQLPMVCDGAAVEAHARLRLGRPMLPDTVFVAFGEVVIVGDLVSSGYLGIDGGGFGAVTTADGSRRRAFATADRVAFDDNGFAVFSGRRDAIVKVAGKRVDIAEVSRRIAEDAAVSDVAVELHNGSLGVWFEARRTREGDEDAAAAARIRRLLAVLGVSSFFVVAVRNIPRKPNGKIDSDSLRTMPQLVGAAVPNDTEAGETATGLAAVWSLHLGRAIRPDSSLLGEGIGSLDLIRILPYTRTYLGRHLSILDLISADTATNLVSDLGSGPPAEIDRDLAALSRTRPRIAPRSIRRPGQAIVVLGASGILGTGFARAVLEAKQSGVVLPDVVFVTRSPLPAADPWASLAALDGVRIASVAAGFDAEELDALLHATGAGTVVNCVGNTNVVVPYRELRPANVELVSAIVEACANHGIRLVHLSTFVVNADVTGPHVTDPRESPYPYAASKSLAELVVVSSPSELDFTIVRLPRVLGEDYQLRETADILVSVVDACTALRAYPRLTLTEEVTTGRAVAHAILGLLHGFSAPAELGRGVTVVHGEAVAYAELLSGYGLDELDVVTWKHRLDQSDWAKRNPRRWSVVDAWVTLGMRLGPRSYAEYLAEYPTIALGGAPVGELVATPESVRELLARSDRNGSSLSQATASWQT